MADTQDKIDPEDLPVIEMIDPTKAAHEKPIADLTINEAMVYRMDDIFPMELRNEKREARHGLYADDKFFRALRKMNEYITGERSTLQYGCFKWGIRKILDKYLTEITEMEGCISRIDSNPQTEGGIEIFPKTHIVQRSGKRTVTGFYRADGERIKILAEDTLGMEIGSFLAAAFWMSAITCDQLPDDLKVYGKSILKQFDDLLRLRLINLHAIGG